MPMFQDYFDFFSSYGTSELSYLFTMHKGDPENFSNNEVKKHPFFFICLKSVVLAPVVQRLDFAN